MKGLYKFKVEGNWSITHDHSSSCLVSTYVPSQSIRAHITYIAREFASGIIKAHV